MLCAAGRRPDVIFGALLRPLAALTTLVLGAGAAFVPAAHATSRPMQPEVAGRFCDTVGHPQEAGIEAVAEAYVAEGGTDGCFRPDAAVTRGQMAAFLQRGYDLTGGSDAFCDTTGHSHETAVRAVAAAGIARGGDDGCYRPDDPVTRGQMASFLVRAEQLTTSDGGAFCDTAGHVHEEAIGAVADEGIAEGYDDGCFGPDDLVTRGQMATFLVRALGDEQLSALERAGPAVAVAAPPEPPTVLAAPAPADWSRRPCPLRSSTRPAWSSP